MGFISKCSIFKLPERGANISKLKILCDVWLISLDHVTYTKILVLSTCFYSLLRVWLLYVSIGQLFLIDTIHYMACIQYILPSSHTIPHVSYLSSIPGNTKYVIWKEKTHQNLITNLGTIVQKYTNCNNCTQSYFCFIIITRHWGILITFTVRG